MRFCLAPSSGRFAATFSREGRRWITSRVCRWLA
ncbi:MAG: LCI fold-containing protein [Phycisphaerales bacterium JB050]